MSIKILHNVIRTPDSQINDFDKACYMGGGGGGGQIYNIKVNIKV